MGRFGRFIVEYVGNLDLSYRADRRTNRRARELMDWIKGQMEARKLPAARKHELVRGLRHALRQGGPVSGGTSANDTTAEGMPEWVPDAKGFSKDAPS
jgi:hypothetical protein